MENEKSDYETIVVKDVENEKQFEMNLELIKYHYNDLSYVEFIEFMSDEYASVGIDPEQYDVVDMMIELGIFEKCPECDEISEGTTFLWEVNKTMHQCKNGHMWEEIPPLIIFEVSMNIYKLDFNNEKNYPDYGFLDFIIVANNIDEARTLAYNESKIIAYADGNLLDRSVVSCKKIGICTDETIVESVILASSFTND